MKSVRRIGPGALLAGAMLLALAACDGGISVVRSPTLTYSAGPDIRALAANGTNAVVVRNSPVPPRAVVDAMRTRYASNQYRFALAPVGPDWNGYTVIIGFGGPPLGTHNQCEMPDIPLSAAAAGETVVTGDYCWRDRLIAEAVGRSPVLTGASDPRLRNLVGDIVAELLVRRP